ncbi:MAG: hypothetical protein B6D39_04765 [Anaerolineae bacterium UTCFX2]|jgi:transcriptional regulator with XRE-family HTH domain|nr:cupin domain-containing protein [Anaerolineales bacterium]OQY92340.1 MAG: hypothetical protein B6D39_04765 [Anaerolineae bacterium UTCFX2]
MPEPIAKTPPRRDGKPLRRRRQSFHEALRTAAGASRFAAVDVGQKLRALRAERGLTLRSLSKLSGLNVNTLSMIENARTSPSVSTLQQLAYALNAPITSFFETPQTKQSIVFYKANQRPKLSFAMGVLEELGSGLAKQGAEPFLVELQPQAESGETPVVHTGLEFVYCLEGELKYTIEEQDYLLAAGDSLLFEAHLPHRWQNVSGCVSRSLLVFCPSNENDQPITRHFSSLDRE